MALAYGGWLVWSGWSRHRLTGQKPPLIGAGVVGGLAALGGLIMLLGADAGRGIALMGALLGTLFFGWMLSRAIVDGTPTMRDFALLAIGVALMFFLIQGSPTQVPR